MDEDRLLQRLRDSAGQIEIPDSLKPDHVAERLRELKREKQRERRRKIMAYAGMAAGIVVLIGAAMAAGRYDGLQSKNMAGGRMNSADKADTGSTASEAAQDTGRGLPAAGEPADDLYRAAGDYGEVYDSVSKAWKKEQVIYESDTKSDGTETGTKSETTYIAVPGDTSGYSGTNLQNENVDEGDFVKTDGEYLYVASGSDLQIIDIREGIMKQPARLSLGSLTAELESGGVVHELYVDGDTLQLVCGGRDGEVVYDSETEAYRMDEKVQVKVLTFDISDRTHPRLSGKFVQDGEYQSSRRNGGHLYLFTRSTIGVPEHRYLNIGKDSAGGWLPCVNGEVQDYSDIYLPEEGGTRAVTVSSIADEAPAKAVDSKTVILGNATEYVSETGIYLYRTEYGEENATSIVKFRYEDGAITMAGGIYVDGSIRDTFAVNEKDGFLRVLTTTEQPESSNHVYILDDSMQLCGKLDGLAAGEEIYSARFLGDYGYFVTYQNTDPLFSVDLSDPKAPRVIGELKVTGFSDYLHFWTADRLLGIGLETDPDTGQQLGVKLSMYDITDPRNVTEENKAVLTRINHSAALTDYKTVLVDEGRNMIGFPVRDNDGRERYLIYRYSVEQGFEKKFSSETDHFSAGDEVRGLYAGSYFYLVSRERAEAFDMDHDFAEAGTVIF